MKVYIVVERMYGLAQIICCFRDKEDAQSFIEMQSNQRSLSILQMDLK